MAVDPATQFQQAGLNIPYSYTPVETKLNQPIQLPGTGELWAKVGQTALEAASQIQKSPLNPAVREQMKYAVDQYKLGQEHNAFMRKLGPMGQMLTQTTPEGATSVAPGTITDPTMAALFREALKLGPSPGGDGDDGKKPPAVNNPAYKKADGQDEPSPEVKLPGGPPPGTFMNPATNTFEPLQQPSPAEKQPAPPATKKAPPTTKESGTAQLIQPTNMFAATTAAPPGPDQFQGPTQADTTAAVQEALSRNRVVSSEQGIPADYQPPTQEVMRQWQDKNAHPVAPAGAARDWARANFDTRVQDATYMPNGGPLNQPAYLFHMKGGGSNMVPLHQMVQNGFAGDVAGHNTSMTLSAADQGQGQQMQPTGAVGGQPPALQQGQGTQPVAQMQPTGNVGQPQPPAAPEMRDIYGNPVSAYTSIPSKGGPSATQLTADTESAGTAATAQPRPLWEMVRQEEQDSVQAKAKDMGDQSGEYTGDHLVPGTYTYKYYRDDDPDSPSRGRVYTILPGRAGEYFNQQRWYLGSTNYESYELPDSMLRKNVADYWIPSGDGPSRQEIAHMGPAELKQWARQAWINQNTTKGPADAGTNLTIDTAERSHNNINQIRDILQTLAENGYPNLSVNDRMRAASENAGVSLTSKRPRNQQGFIEGLGTDVGGVMGGAGDMDSTTAAAIRTLDQKVNEEQELLAANPHLLINPGKGGGQETPNIHGSAINFELANIPQSTVLSDSAFSGQDIKTKLKALDSFQTTGDTRYKSLIGTAQDNWQRVDPKHVRNIVAMDKGQDIPDPGNRYKSHLFTVDPNEYAGFAKAHPDTPFMTTDGRRLRTPKPLK